MYIVCHVHEFTHNLVNMETPVVWVRVDPEIKWIRQLVMEQSDTVWLCLLKCKWDGNAQVNTLEGIPWRRWSHFRPTRWETPSVILLVSTTERRNRQQRACERSVGTNRQTYTMLHVVGLDSPLHELESRLVQCTGAWYIALIYMYLHACEQFISSLEHVPCSFSISVLVLLTFLSCLLQYSDFYLVSGLIDSLAVSITP